MAVGEYVGTTYQQIQQAVADYYGSGSDAWARIYAGAGGYYSADAAKVIQQVPGVTVTYSNSGKVLGYSYANPYASAGSAASVIDSNVQTGSYGAGSFTNSVPSTVVDNGHGQLVAQSGSKLASTGATVATVVDRLSLAAVGVSLGTKLGKAIDSAIYSVNPDWWDMHLPNMNPETWDDMATTQSGRQFIQAIFGLEADVTTMYIDERMLAYAYQMMLQEGFYNQPGIEFPPSVSSGTRVQITSLSDPMPIINSLIALSSGYTFSDTAQAAIDQFLRDCGSGFYKIRINVDSGGFSGWSPFNIDWAPCTVGTTISAATTLNNARNLSTYGTRSSSGGPCRITNTRVLGGSTVFNIGETVSNGMATAYNVNTTTVDPMQGVSDDPRAQININPDTLINPTTSQPVTPQDNVQDVLDALRQQYPQLFTDSIYQDTPQEDGSVDRITYIPVPIPDGVTTPSPTTGETSQTDPSVNPDDNTDSLIEQIIQILTHPETQPQTDTTTDTPIDTPTPPDTGDGDTPIVPPITGSASSLWKIYNPTQVQIDAFGAWLWSSDFIDQLKKLFNDPMQAIIGVHKVFCTPSIGGSTTIKCGYLDSEVPSNWVSNQYTHIDCGTVSLPEYFGNVFDYDPFTRVSLFLPCVGIVPLDVAEVMRSSINVKLHCDVLTGALLAEVNVIRDQAGGILYTYSGSCIVTYPVSSGTYVGAVANVVSVAASVAAGIMSTVASGGALAPAAVGAAGAAVSGLAHTRTNVQHSGSFSGAAGVMGGKIPYLIITRPQTRMADQYPAYDGVPANFTSRLGDCTGYVKVKEVHLKVPNAYESEIAEIENLLYQGVLI